MHSRIRRLEDQVEELEAKLAEFKAAGVKLKNTSSDLLTKQIQIYGNGQTLILPVHHECATQMAAALEAQTEFYKLLT